ncbi:hypothetical protein DSO57_1037085 [Entomophthora muscae]|uniref:Uncharacterized protein n=1 Tax=Entomophthora muscae TaxID=34485 RepID=A0ACC2TA17_9FUNG|nr:hypothetical protein DSO57_1037085 [Entomophthora muscae]
MPMQLVVPRIAQPTEVARAEASEEELVVLGEDYCINSIELVWNALGTLPFNKIPEIEQAHRGTVLKLAVSNVTAAKKTNILLEDFDMACSKEKT